MVMSQYRFEHCGSIKKTRPIIFPILLPLRKLCCSIYRIIFLAGVLELHHPFHLHGYAFNIMSVGVPNNGTGVTAEEIKEMDRRGLIRRRRTSPPYKDTLAVPNNGYVIVRFRADNPGEYHGF